MSTITIKDIPARMHSTLKSRARAHHRSLNKEVIATIESILHDSSVVATNVGEHARAVREAMGVYLTEKDLRTFKNAGRR